MSWPRLGAFVSLSRRVKRGRGLVTKYFDFLNWGSFGCSLELHPQVNDIGKLFCGDGRAGELGCASGTGGGGEGEVNEEARKSGIENLNASAEKVLSELRVCELHVHVIYKMTWRRFASAFSKGQRLNSIRFDSIAHHRSLPLAHAPPAGSTSTQDTRRTHPPPPRKQTWKTRQRAPLLLHWHRKVPWQGVAQSRPEESNGRQCLQPHA